MLLHLVFGRASSETSHSHGLSIIVTPLYSPLLYHHLSPLLPSFLALSPIPPSSLLSPLLLFSPPLLPSYCIPLPCISVPRLSSRLFGTDSAGPGTARRARRVRRAFQEHNRTGGGVDEAASSPGRWCGVLTTALTNGRVLRTRIATLIKKDAFLARREDTPALCSKINTGAGEGRGGREGEKTPHRRRNVFG